MTVITSINAQDRYFARTYTSSILPRGSIDLELWHTSRMGHESQFYYGMDQRMEMEVGLGKYWQTALYFNHYSERKSTSADGTVVENEMGFSNEWKVRIANETKSRPSIALYGEWGVKGGDELELEGKVIADKSLGKHLLALNLVGEKEYEWAWQNQKTTIEGAINAEIDLGYLYNFSIPFGAGVEVVDRNRFEAGKWDYSVLSAGPTLNYRGDRWFVLLNVLPQWSNLHKTPVAPGKRDLMNNERVEARIIAGISF